MKRVLGTPALFATAYSNVGSSIYYALGLSPLVFALVGGRTIREVSSHNPSVFVKATPALAGLLAAVSVVAGCGGGGDRQLDVLELENLASFVAPGGTIEAEPETSDREVARVFAYEDAAAAEAGRAAAIEAATASGWTLTFDDDHPGDPIFGAKELATGDVRLVIGKYEEDELVKVSILLEHGPCTRCKPGGQQASEPVR
jgi:hypothetical protein